MRPVACLRGGSGGIGQRIPPEPKNSLFLITSPQKCFVDNHFKLLVVTPNTEEPLGPQIKLYDVKTYERLFSFWNFVPTQMFYRDLEFWLNPRGRGSKFKKHCYKP